MLRLRRCRPPQRIYVQSHFFSLIETAKANGLEPFGYLRYVFERLPLLQAPDEYCSLLPQYIDR